MNKQIIIKTSNEIEILGSNRMPKALVDELSSILIMENPKYKGALDHGYSTRGIPKRLHYMTKNSNGNWVMPRGFYYRLQNIIKRYGIPFRTIDKCMTVEDVEIDFIGELREDQPEAASAILDNQYGLLSRGTGGGKTVIALYVIAKRRQPTLIVVHTKELMYQWQERAEGTKYAKGFFGGLKKGDIGLIGDGKKSVGRILTVAIVNSLSKYLYLVKDSVGQLIIDEAHKIPSTTFSNIISHFDCRFFLGLSATLNRRDGLGEVIKFYIGDIVHTGDIKHLQAKKQAMKPSLTIIKTNFSFYIKNTFMYSSMIKKLTSDVDRNDLIVKEVIKHSKKNNSREISLVISDRKEHCRVLYNKFKQKFIRVGILIGGMSNKERRETKEKLNAGYYDVLVATSQLIGEGLDCPTLASIFLTTPIGHSLRLIQYIGRIVRMIEGKRRAMIFDFEDPLWLLQHSFKKRMKVYNELEIKQI